jgi:hypothetical protein
MTQSSPGWWMQSATHHMTETFQQISAVTRDSETTYTCRMMYPCMGGMSCLRGEVLAGLHAAHQCVTKVHDRAMHAVFWLGLYKDLEGVRNSCSYCNKFTPTQAALPPHELLSPDYPFQMIVMDYCSIKGKSWLVCADRFTGWVSTYYFPREAVASDLVRLMKEYFATFGVAEHISSDEGSQFVSSKFVNFLQSWGADCHKISSAYNPHSNLRAETAVKTEKRRRGSSPCATGCPWGARGGHSTPGNSLLSQWGSRCSSKIRGEQASWPRNGTELGQLRRIKAMTSIQSRLMAVED